MQYNSAVIGTPEQRLPTGIPGLDEILCGGLLPQRSYLVVGPAGAGKTVLAMQWLREGHRQGKRAVYMSLGEPSHEITQNLASFGWQLDGIDLLDLTPHDEPDDAPNGDYQIFPPSEVEYTPVWRNIYQAVTEKRPDWLVIDSLTQLRYLSTDEYQFRKKILSLVRFLNASGCTTLLTFETSELERTTAVELAVDGLIRLRNEVSPSRVVALRSVQLAKFRGSDFLSGIHPFRFMADGIHVFPHRTEPTGAVPPAETLLSSGSAQLDTLLGGGLESHTTTIFSGPSGVGKTTMGVEFLRAGIARGERAVLFSFEEPVESILRRARGIGAPLESLLDAGSLNIIRLNPLQQYPDEFLAQVRKAVAQDGATMVMIDSLRGYQLEMEQFGSTLAHIHNLVNYLSRLGVTCLLINEVEAITGDLRVTEIGVSHLADNIILLRYAEYEGQVIKVVACLKKRLGNFQPELRELRIGAGGLSVGGKLDKLQGVLTGVPRSRPDAEPPR